jgi:hypothetical protein
MKKSLFALPLVAAALAFAGSAGAAPGTPPGGDAAYQVEISANISGPTGGGIWLWLELDKDGGGVYAGSDCGHGGGGASSDKGTLTWQQVGDQLVISGVALNGLPPFAQGPITVPATYGHYRETIVDAFPGMATFFSVIGAPLDTGFSQVQVAP